MNHFAQNIQLIRESMGLTQSAVAQKIGVKRTRYGAWEEGRAYPRVRELFTLCEALGTTDIYALFKEKLGETGVKAI